MKVYTLNSATFLKPLFPKEGHVSQELSWHVWGHQTVPREHVLENAVCQDEVFCVKTTAASVGSFYFFWQLSRIRVSSTQGYTMTRDFVLSQVFLERRLLTSFLPVCSSVCLEPAPHLPPVSPSAMVTLHPRGARFQGRRQWFLEVCFIK